jgi:hypothetical protein
MDSLAAFILTIFLAMGLGFSAWTLAEIHFFSWLIG